MRGLTTRNVRPCLQHSRNRFLIPLVRSATLPPLQKAFACADAFLFFLPSVLTAALVIHCTGTERRRAEWDHQIAIAQGEVDGLQQRQIRAWSRIQRRSVSHGAWQQRRTLITTSQKTYQLDEETEALMDPLGRQVEINAGDEGIESDLRPEENEVTEDDVTKQKRFGRLLATKLALEMMLLLRLGKASRYKAEPSVNTASKVYHQSMDYIVQELEKVAELMRLLEIQKVPWDVPMPEEFRGTQHRMALRMTDLCNKYRNVDIHLPDFVMSFVQLITDFKIGLPNQSYVEIMRVLTFHQRESRMARHVEDALLDSHERLDCYTISNMLYHHGMAADSFRFSQFLERLTRADQHPRPRSPWYRLHVNDVDICVPKSTDGHIITGLIRTALQCRQSTVAEAYAVVFVDRDRIEKYSAIHKWFMLSSFLQSYGNWMSWETGQKWLRLAVLWMSELASSEEHVMGRVVLRMLDFCVACGKRDDYNAIMEAVIVSRMPVPELTPGAKVTISARMGAIRSDWDRRTRRTNSGQSEELRPPRQEQAKTFSLLLHGRWSSASKSPADISQPLNVESMEQGYLAFNPIVAAERMTQVSEQRQQTINHGFKGFDTHEHKITRSLFPPPGEHNTLSSEPVADDAKVTSQSTEFVSPYFQPPHETTSSPSNTVASEPTKHTVDGYRARSSARDPNPDVIALERSVKIAEFRLSHAKSVAETRLRQLQEMEQQLESAKSKLLEEGESPVTPLTADEDDEATIRSSASG